VVASRLSEDPSIKVLLVDRGPLVETWASHVPLLSADFNAKTAPVYRWMSDAGSASFEHGELDMLSGKAFGGTSKVNVSIYHRCIPAEYNAWAAAGRQGWAWDDVEPFFKMSEKSLSSKSNDRGHQGKSLTVPNFYTTEPDTQLSSRSVGESAP
jgi:choline dehydrogenase